MGKIRPPHAARPARPRSARHRQIRGGGDGRGKPWPFPGVRPVCPHSISSPPPSQEGGSGWVEEAVWSPWLAGRGCLGTWELGVLRPAGAWSRASAGGRGTQRSAGRAGRERGAESGSGGGCSLSLPTVPCMGENRERVSARLCAWEVGSQTLPLSTPRGKTQAPLSKGVCVTPGEGLSSEG